jgi:transcriptional regulator with PAS, ATPase and Fis domain
MKSKALEEESAVEKPLQQMERERIVATLAKQRDRKGAAAAALGISRSTLWCKFYEHRLR